MKNDAISGMCGEPRFIFASSASFTMTMIIPIHSRSRPSIPDAVRAQTHPYHIEPEDRPRTNPPERRDRWGPGRERVYVVGNSRRGSKEHLGLGLKELVLVRRPTDALAIHCSTLR